MTMTTRLDSLRKKLAARDGIPGYKKNCEALWMEIARLEIARLEQVQPPSADEIEAAWKSAEEARASESETTSTEAPKSGDA